MPPHQCGCVMRYASECAGGCAGEHKPCEFKVLLEVVTLYAVGARAVEANVFVVVVVVDVLLALFTSEGRVAVLNVPERAADEVLLTVPERAFDCCNKSEYGMGEWGRNAYHRRWLFIRGGYGS